uniref:RNA-binding protein 28 n=1 Tax=Erigeron canadensis TaxID=72917 RepID=UPI001CB9C91D|nr:RNA-binding protein 28 [Erigeron canadensis]
MALLRFVCFPSSTAFFSSSSNQQNPHHFLFQHNNNSISIPSSTCSLQPNRFFIKSSPPPPNFQIHSSAATTQADNSTSQQQQQEEEFSKTRLLAQNVNWTCTADDIRPLFEKYGTVVDIEVSMFSKTKNRGLVFVSMGSHEEALAAFTNLQSYEFMGRPLNLTWAKPKKTKTPSAPAQPRTVPVHNLFVANLPYQARSKDLKELFSAENPNVVSAEIIFKENPRGSAGYGFVSFNTKQEAEDALSAFQGKVFMGRAIRVSPSKQFLRQATKKALASKDESTKSEPEGEKAQTAEVGTQSLDQ